MPWRQTSRMEERIQFLDRALAGPVNFAALCREYGISRVTGYKWRDRYMELGSVFEAAGERSRRPRRSPRRTPAELEELVLAMRRRFDWGARKIGECLDRQGVKLAVPTVHRIIARHGLISPEESHRPATKRFERESPNELWQMDFKGYYEVTTGRCFPLSILDDHSRYLLGLSALPQQRAEGVRAELVKAFERCGVPQAMLLDHGTLWWGTQGAAGLTALSVWIMKQGVRLHFCGVGHPQTQGKIERFHRTLAREVRRQEPRISSLAAFQALFNSFRDTYNRLRPHEALGMEVPASRYRPSDHAYNPQPPEWVYPAGSDVRRLDERGRLEHEGRRHFVCEALRGERVAVERVDNLLLVQFQNTHVREINLENNETRAAKLKKQKQNV